MLSMYVRLQDRTRCYIKTLFTTHGNIQIQTTFRTKLTTDINICQQSVKYITHSLLLHCLHNSIFVLFCHLSSREKKPFLIQGGDAKVYISTSWTGDMEVINWRCYNTHRAASNVRYNYKNKCQNVQVMIKDRNLRDSEQ